MKSARILMSTAIAGVVIGALFAVLRKNIGQLSWLVFAAWPIVYLFVDFAVAELDQLLRRKTRDPLWLQTDEGREWRKSEKAKSDAQLAVPPAALVLSFEEHLSRLLSFVRPMPGCPTWSRVLVAENLGDVVTLDLLQSPAEYASRFSELLASRPWVNLHAVGLWRQALVVSVEVARDARPSSTPASVQLSGPEASIAALPDWNIELRRDT